MWSKAIQRKEEVQNVIIIFWSVVGLGNPGYPGSSVYSRCPSCSKSPVVLFLEPTGEYILDPGWTSWSVVGLGNLGYPSSPVYPRGPRCYIEYISQVALSIEPARKYRASSDSS